jgi:hypothetical protein
MSQRSFTAWLAMVAMALLFAAPARAQESLAIGTGTANFGVRELRAPRPNAGAFEVSVRTGGTLNVRPLLNNPRCLGWVTREPDLILRVMTPVPALRIWVESARDTTLVVNTHDGRWRCDDDSAGRMNPQVLIDEAGVGQYDIWVGSYARGVAVQGVLHVEPVSFVHPASGTIAAAGTIDLPSEFTPETRSINIPTHPAGTLDARWVVPNCYGSITAMPDAILRVGEGLPILRITAPQVENGSYIVVRGPDRQWRCSSSRSPLTIESPAAGGYHLWVAQRIPLPLYTPPQRIADGGVTDASFTTPDAATTMPAARIDVSRAPLLLTGGATGTLATQEISPGFAPDPQVITVADRAPGPVRAEELGVPGCTGFVFRQPDLVLRVQSSLSLLRIFAASATDTVLVIRSPSGWRCRDDMFGFNPGVDFTDAQPGQYDVWVGSYSEGARHAATLSITSNPSQRPVDPNQPPPNGASTSAVGAQPSSTQNVGLSPTVQPATSAAPGTTVNTQLTPVPGAAPTTINRRRLPRVRP